MTRMEQILYVISADDPLALSVWNEYCRCCNDAGSQMWKEMSVLPSELSGISADDISLFETVLHRFRAGRDLDSVDECPANTSRLYYRYGKDGNFETTDDPLIHTTMSELRDAVQYFIEHPDKYPLQDRFSKLLWYNAPMHE